MKYALAGGKRVEAYLEGRATCPVCGSEVIAKCGTHRVHHWAHRGIQDCDSWVEKETEWHRAWKNYFPAECQEFVQHDGQSGERHIADVRTSHGLVLEFQHSHLNSPERAAREGFYGNMVWVVDGTRLKRDYPRFVKGKDQLRRTNNQGYFLLSFPEECFPATWLDSSVPVVFDFRGVYQSQPPDAFKDGLWCLLPGRAEGSAVVVCMSREEFIKVAPSRPQLLAAQQIVTDFARRIREARAADAFATQRFTGMPGGWRPRRRSIRL
ncbi:competence protein [Bradyrhizobium sp. YR681]|uniref:competence protein CoiA n=1 Tax=Bradyrhizobium sp. YR681 TaxID=1144344 RepID=UPI000270EE12|nr:competence protein CoiA family protein [Bradyrhizobium sp. YR681]EJN16274.1 competence protein [Bradyrhizobium sp. YR681]